MLTNQSWNWLAIFVLLLFAGCATSPDLTYEESDDYQPYDTDAESAGISQIIGNEAVVGIWQEAEEANKAGDYETAAMLLERALRIEPTEAVLWSELAEIQLLQQNANQAENLATKSNAMSLDNPMLNYRNWLIIAKARQLKGDDIGAQEAEYTANTFKP